MAGVSVMRFNMCAVNLFHGFKMCKMIAQETALERNLPERPETNRKFDLPHWI